ncbi:hypothetical protein FACS1894207_3170 [Bacteroidia bacterium]|nr:hypothetical protein FACS1894207_3170 [Bacteroidia bacterium]
MSRTKAVINSADVSMYRYPYQNHSLTDMEGEIWKPVPDFEEYYMVSNLGRIKRLARQVSYNDGRKYLLAERIVHISVIKRYSTQRNEFRLQLSFSAITENEQRCMMVSRAVYSAFVKKPDNKEKEKWVVLHRDSDTLNNRLENLYLTGRKEMVARNLRESLFIIPFSQPGVKGKAAAAAMKKVSQYDLLGNFIRSYPSVREAERQTGVLSSSIKNVACERQKHAGGFIWRYDTEIQKLDSRTLSAYSNPTQVKINQYDADGFLAGVYKNVRRVFQSMHYTESEYKCLKQLLRQGNGTTQYKGYTWKYATLC